VILRTESVSRTYRPGTPHEIHAVSGVSLEIPRGRITLIRGPSGSGKTTLLCLLGTLLRPTSGKIFLEDREITSAADAERTRIRRHRMGFVFQGFHLVPGLPAWQNVSYPLVPRIPSERERRDLAMRFLAELDLEERATHAPEELSGGEQQRVAIARALVGGPDILLADEPTASIDEASVANLLVIFQRLRDDGMTIVVVSHDERLLSCADQVHHLVEGRLEEEA
jgi:putative ABC transport system ATP-binding protein